MRPGLTEQAHLIRPDDSINVSLMRWVYELARVRAVRRQAAEWRLARVRAVRQQAVEWHLARMRAVRQQAVVWRQTS